MSALATATRSAVRVTGLRKAFGSEVVLDGIDLEIAEETVFALLGPNGAGKTTTVRILSTLLPAPRLYAAVNEATKRWTSSTISSTLEATAFSTWFSSTSRTAAIRALSSVPWPGSCQSRMTITPVRSPNGPLRPFCSRLSPDRQDAHQLLHTR